jgi:hypothetical protein
VKGVLRMFKLEDKTELIDEFYWKLKAVGEAEASIKPSDDAWSLKEIVGHLIDSASNNHQRFVRLQTGNLLNFPAYDGELWIRLQEYNGADWELLTGFWHSYNRMLIRIIGNLREEALQNYWEKGEEKLTLEHIAVDYYRHLIWHIEHFDRRLKEVRGQG